MLPKTPGIHSGHRARMRNRFYQTGLNGFDAHEVLELILFAAIPKKDVNPLAHALVDRFGSVDAVLAASEQELEAVPGVGKHTSAIFRALNELCNYYAAHRFSGVRTLGCIRDVFRHAELSYHRNYAQELFVMYEDPFGALLTVRAFPARLQDPAVLQESLRLALEVRAHSVVFLLKGFFPLRPLSKALLEEIGTLICLYSGVDIYVLDFILLSGDHALSLRMENLLADSQSGSRIALPLQTSWFDPLHHLPETCGWRCLPKSMLYYDPLAFDQNTDFR